MLKEEERGAGSCPKCALGWTAQEIKGREGKAEIIWERRKLA